MCGLGGYAGVGSELLAWALGIALDDRGGDAAGYVTDKAWATRVGPWSEARRRFSRGAGSGSVGIIHTRFATCGQKTQRDAHPFRVSRGASVLYGAHNGMIDDAEESAELNGRPYTVDSRELFELIADAEWSAISKLSGYGVASWIIEGESAVQLVRLTESGELCFVSIEGGGYAWASTWTALKQALTLAGLNAVNSYNLEVGVVYRVTPSAIVATATTCKFSERPRWNWNDWSGLTVDDYDEILDKKLFDKKDDDEYYDPVVKDDDKEQAEYDRWADSVGKWATDNRRRA